MLTTMDPNPSKGTPVVPSPSSGFEVDDASIYFYVKQRGGDSEWFAMIWGGDKDNSKIECEHGHEYLQLVFPDSPAPKQLDLSASCGVVGSTIYVIGGVDMNMYVEENPMLGRSPVKDVYYIDTDSPAGGWKKGQSTL